MDRRYIRTSSLAAKFFTDYETAQVMPLDELTPDERQLLVQHVQPLMDADGGGLDALLAQVDRLVAALGAITQEGGRRQALYDSLWRVADYVQSTLALLLILTAGEEASASGRAWSQAVAAASPDTHREWRREALARRLLRSAQGSQLMDADLAGLVAPLEQATAMAGAGSAEGGDAWQAADAQLEAGAALAAGAYTPFARVTAAAREHRMSHCTPSGKHQVLLPAGQWLKGPALRRRLEQASGRALQEVLGTDSGKGGARGSVVLAGEALRLAIQAKLFEGDHATLAALAGVPCPSFDLFLVGFEDAAAAAACVESCAHALMAKIVAKLPGARVSCKAKGGWLVLRLASDACAYVFRIHLRAWPSVAQLLLGPCSPAAPGGMAYDGSTLWATPLAARELAMGVTLAGPAAPRQLLADWALNHLLAAARGAAVCVPLPRGAPGEELRRDIWAALGEAAFRGRRLAGLAAGPGDAGMARLMALDVALRLDGLVDKPTVDAGMVLGQDWARGSCAARNFGFTPAFVRLHQRWPNSVADLLEAARVGQQQGSAAGWWGWQHSRPAWEAPLDALPGPVGEGEPTETGQEVPGWADGGLAPGVQDAVRRALAGSPACTPDWVQGAGLQLDAPGFCSMPGQV